MPCLFSASEIMFLHSFLSFIVFSNSCSVTAPLYVIAFRLILFKQVLLIPLQNVDDHYSPQLPFFHCSQQYLFFDESSLLCGSCTSIYLPKLFKQFFLCASSTRTVMVLHSFLLHTPLNSIFSFTTHRCLCYLFFFFSHALFLCAISLQDLSDCGSPQLHVFHCSQKHLFFVFVDLVPPSIRRKHATEVVSQAWRSQRDVAVAR